MEQGQCMGAQGQCTQSPSCQHCWRQLGLRSLQPDVPGAWTDACHPGAEGLSSPQPLTVLALSTHRRLEGRDLAMQGGMPETAGAAVWG